MKCVLSFEYMWMGPEMTEHDKFYLMTSFTCPSVMPYPQPPSPQPVVNAMKGPDGVCVCVCVCGGGGVRSFCLHLSVILSVLFYICVSVSVCCSLFSVCLCLSVLVYICVSVSVVLCLLFSVSLSLRSRLYLCLSLCE